MKKIISFLIWCGLLIILCVSCQGIYTHTPIPSVTPEIPLNWWTSWLAHPVCKSPCWQNITPGVTTKDEASLILEDAPELTITYRTEDVIQWEFNQNKDEEIGWLHISENGKVSWLLNTAGEDLILEKVIASYGDPQFVKPYDCMEGMCSVALIYPHLGISLSIYIESEEIYTASPRFRILPDDVINRVYFFDPELENFPNLYNLDESELPMPWKGYGEYP